MSWYYESWRHALSARGYSTYRKSYAGKLSGTVITKTRHGIPITMKDSRLNKNEAYPMSPNDAKKVLDSMPPKMVDGIKEINFRKPCDVPGTKQRLAYAQWIRTKEDGKNRINVFAQEFKDGEFQKVEPGNEDPSALRRHMMGYVLPHEVGHHYVESRDNGLPGIVGEASADAVADHQNPYDPEVLNKYVDQRVMVFGEKGTI
jgi:hypothetical protein